MKEAIIDTDILSYYLKGDLDISRKVRDYLELYHNLNISIITQYEILGGLEYKKATKQIQEFESFLKECNVVNLTNNSIYHSAKAFGRLRRKGVTIGTSDLLIAGQALEQDWGLITNNEKHFKDIEGLDIDNWRKG